MSTKLHPSGLPIQTKITAYATDCGDCSVGIFAQTWEIECPFYEEEALSNRFRNREVKSYEDATSNKVVSTFFEITYFKKGTIHIVFRDKFVWDEFNLRAAKGKGWLGDGD